MLVEIRGSLPSAGIWTLDKPHFTVFMPVWSGHQDPEIESLVELGASSLPDPRAPFLWLFFPLEQSGGVVQSDGVEQSDGVVQNRHKREGASQVA